MAARRLAAALSAMIALLVLILAAGSEAQACPPGAKADQAAGIAHTTAKADRISVKHAAAANHAAQTPAALAACCGGSHSGGTGGHGTCSSCAFALAATDTAVLAAADTAAYGLSGRTSFPLANAPPQFRPPRHAV